MTEKYTPADGAPIPEFTLGPRYGSEDMYRDMGIAPGSRVAFEKDGVVFTDTVQSVTYSSAESEIVRRLSWWQRIVRRLTPKRYRKSLVVRPHKPETVTVNTGPVEDDVLERHQGRITEVLAAVRRLGG
jgi:hypothetical protein